MKEERNDIRQIIARYLAGEANPAEEQLLAEWAAHSKENEREFEQLKKVFNAATLHYSKPARPNIDIEKEWNVFLNNVGSERPVRELHSKSPSLWMRIAASLLLLITTSAIIYYYVMKTESYTVDTTAAIREMVLPDGSKIILNRNSEVRYDDDYGTGNRNIFLKGEAFFNVKKNTDLPFVITAKATTIEVLGTSFNVLAYDSLKSVEVVVKTGIVKFSAPTLNKSVELLAGEKGVFAPVEESLKESTNDDVNFQAWNTRELTFSETPLYQVLETINKTYNANIVLDGTASDSCLLTASFKNQSLEAVLNVLENTLNLTYKRIGNRIEIVAAGC